MSNKNRLQEFYQKRRENLPIYTTTRVPDRPSHDPRWISVVRLHDGREFFSEPFSKKSDAEASAAEKALDNLPFEIKNVPTTVALESPYAIVENCWESSVIVIADVENVPQIIDETFPDEVTVIGLVGHCHALAFKPFPFHKYIIRSSLRDAVDHAVSFLTGFIVGTLNEGLAPTVRKPHILVLSRDHFAEATVWCLYQQNFKGCHVTNVPELMTIIKNLVGK